MVVLTITVTFSLNSYIRMNGVLYLNGLDVNYIEAPTQSLAQRWLRDKHGFFVLVELNSIGLYPHIVGGELDYKGDYYLSYETRYYRWNILFTLV